MAAPAAPTGPMKASAVAKSGADPTRAVTITTERLRAAFRPVPMAQYFGRKLPHLAPDELEARIEETLKFLMLASQCTGSIPVTGDIDEIWHYWILQTQQYDALCAALPAA